MSTRPRSDDPQAVALRHDHAADGAPTVVAKARGELTLRVLELAHEHDVPVREDPDLLQLLAACDLGTEIPVELYTAVAELLAYLYRLNERLDPNA